MIDRSVVPSRMVEAGMSQRAAAAKARLFEEACAAVGATAAFERGTTMLFVPGRIEVLGKHTDYAGGRSLLCTAERGFCVVARPRADRLVHVTDVVSGTRADAELTDPATSGSPAPTPIAKAGPSDLRPGWSLYLDTVVGRVARNFPSATRGADIAFGSDLPIAAGISSSSALVTSLFLALSAVNDLPATRSYRDHIRAREDLAEYLGTIENGQDFRGLSGDAGVGTFGGSEDHTAMLCCRPGELSVYRFCPVRHELQVAMPAGYRFVVAASGVVAEKTAAARDIYNRASLAAREILSRWNAATGRHDASLRAAVEHGADAADRIRDLLTDGTGRAQGGGPASALPFSLLDRFEQFYEETFIIVPRVADLLRQGSVEAAGEFVDRSQRGAERGLGNQVPETVFLADSARSLGAAAASAFGAGFGGSVWALVRDADVERFVAGWRDRYAAAFPQRADASQFFPTRPGPPALTVASSE